MTPKQRILNKLRNCAFQAEDNAVRFRLAARGHDIDREWGESGRSLGELIAGAEQHLTEAQADVEYVQANLPEE
jgi:hypothetical protein